VIVNCSLSSPHYVYQGDRGGEYRSLIGLPGGINGEAFPEVEAAAKKEGLSLKLVEGKGDDPDTLGKKIVWVMDTAKYPFIQAEIYHQYHGKNVA
jgi:hypothetical protein